MALHAVAVEDRGPRREDRHEGSDVGSSLSRPPADAAPECLGGVAERSNAPVLKTGVRASEPWVRIPPPPLSPRKSWLYIALGGLWAAADMTSDEANASQRISGSERRSFPGLSPEGCGRACLGSPGAAGLTRASAEAAGGVKRSECVSTELARRVSGPLDADGRRSYEPGLQLLAALS
jgi:hypothetical protein